MSSITDAIVKLAGTVGKALEDYGTPALEIGKDVVNLIDEAIPVVTSTDAAQLTTTRDTLQTQVMAHADSTENELRG